MCMFNVFPHLQSLKVWEWILWFSKMFAYSYLGIAFYLLTLPNILHYYNSIYHFGVVFYTAALITGLFLLKKKKREAVD